MSDEPKFCKDCKYFKAYPATPIPWGGVIGGYDRCEHPSLVNVVFGSQLSIDAASRRDRNSTTGCGYDALQFEAGVQTPGVLQLILDTQKEAARKEAARKVESMENEHTSFMEQQSFLQSCSWWEFWK